MKTFIQSLALAFSAALMLTASTAVGSENGAKGGAADLVGSKQTQPVIAVVKHTADCPMTKACPDCRTVAKTTTVTEGKGNVTKTVPVSEHLCASCKSGVTTTGHGKTKSTVSTHVCEKVGGKAACCAN